MTKSVNIDENVVRITAGLVVLLSVLFLLTHWTIITILLVADFAIRAFSYQPSFLSIIAKYIVKLFRWKPKPIFAPPKKFAAKIGFVFCLIIFILFSSHIEMAGYTVLGVLIFCALLESIFRICLGCYFFHWIFAWTKNRK